MDMIPYPDIMVSGAKWYHMTIPRLTPHVILGMDPLMSTLITPYGVSGGIRGHGGEGV